MLVRLVDKLTAESGSVRVTAIESGEEIEVRIPEIEMPADAGAMGLCIQDEKSGLWYLAQVEWPGEGAHA